VPCGSGKSGDAAQNFREPGRRRCGGRDPRRRAAMNTGLLAILSIGGAVLYGVAGVLGGRKLVRHHVAEGHNDVLVPVFLTAGVIYAVLLAFLVVAEWEFHDTAYANTAEEAALLVPLYRQTTVMADEKGQEMRHAIRDYTEDVINGWAGFRMGHRNLEAGKDVSEVFRVFGTLTPATKARELIAGQFLQTFTEVIFHRNKRYLHASESLSWIMWLGAIGGGALVVSMTFFLFMERWWPHVAIVSVMSALIGLLLFMVALLSRPFVGPLGIEPTSFEQSLSVFDDVDRGN
jgi:hypothetical protein